MQLLSLEQLAWSYKRRGSRELGVIFTPGYVRLWSPCRPTVMDPFNSANGNQFCKHYLKSKQVENVCCWSGLHSPQGGCTVYVITHWWLRACDECSPCATLQALGTTSPLTAVASAKMLISSWCEKGSTQIWNQSTDINYLEINWAYQRLFFFCLLIHQLQAWKINIMSKDKK